MTDGIDRAGCVTCGDAAVLARVVEVCGATASVEAGGRREQVGIELVAPVEPGEVLLCHAGIALQKVEPARRGHHPPPRYERSERTRAGVRPNEDESVTNSPQETAP